MLKTVVEHCKKNVLTFEESMLFLTTSYDSKQIINFGYMIKYIVNRHELCLDETQFSAASMPIGMEKLKTRDEGSNPLCENRSMG